MSHLRPRARAVPWLHILCAAALAVLAHPSVGRAEDEGLRRMPVNREIARPQGAGGGVFGTANSSCLGAACDTVWVGHNSSGPGGGCTTRLTTNFGVPQVEALVQARLAVGDRVPLIAVAEGSAPSETFSFTPDMLSECQTPAMPVFTYLRPARSRAAHRLVLPSFTMLP